MIVSVSPDDCSDPAWSVTQIPSFVTILSGSSGSGSGAVRFQVSKNETTFARTATMRVAGELVTVRQAGPAFITRNDFYTMKRGTILSVLAPGVFANDRIPPGTMVPQFVIADLPDEAGFVNTLDGGFRLTLPPSINSVRFRYSINFSTSLTAFVMVTVTD